MENNYESGRERQRKIIISVLVIFVIAIVVTAIVSITRPKETDEETTVTSSEVKVEVVENEIIVNEEQVVTGANGENNTLIPATIKKVINSKVLQMTVNDSDVEVSMIGIKIPEDKETEAVNYLNEIFKNSKNVWLQYDEMTVNENNQSLCYIWLSEDANTNLVSSCKDYMLQAKLISEGLAEPIDEYPNSRYEYALNSIIE